MEKSIKHNKKIQEYLLLDLWQASVFDDGCYEVLEKFVKFLDKQKKSGKKIEYNIFTKEVIYALSTVRNKNLINEKEQSLLRNTVVGFFGLSVGSHAALAWLMESRANVMKICDNDTIAPTNLNRLKAGVNDIGIQKTKSLEQKLLELHPNLSIISSDKIDDNSIIGLFDATPKLAVVVDAIDDMYGKIFLRKLAKKRKIPLVSAADVGDNVILDIERYDLTPQPKLFLGRLPGIESTDFSKLSERQRKKLIIKLVGFEKNSKSLLNSLISIGKDIATWPQLGATATIAGGVIATTIKKIVLGENVKSGRYYISLDDILVVDFNSDKNKKNRLSTIEKIKHKFKI